MIRQQMMVKLSILEKIDRNPFNYMRYPENRLLCKKMQVYDLETGVFMQSCLKI